MLKERIFTARAILEKQKAEGLNRKLVGFEMIDRGIPRHGYELVKCRGEKVGEVTLERCLRFVKSASVWDIFKLLMLHRAQRGFIDVRGRN